MFYNIVIFFLIANVLYWTIPVVSLAFDTMLYSRNRLVSPRRFLVSNLASYPWAGPNVLEVSQLSTVYRSFVGWRREPFRGETINIEGPYSQRRTINAGTSDEKTAYFFGGSTMWGTGSNDSGTIPSQFAAITGIHSENFGETAYTAHQGLVFLIQLLQDGHRPDLVVFYDGVNDVSHKCRRELTPTSHAREQQIASVLKTSSDPTSFSYFFAPAVTAASALNRKFFGSVSDAYDCHANPRKAESIAENMIQDWLFAKKLVESYGGTFIAILQPVSYFSQTYLDHLKLPKEFATEFNVVYPTVRKKMATKRIGYDLTSALDVDDYIYTDFCHVTPKGNRIIAEKIAEIVAPLRFGH
jgi:lysophospholipase L1-like esterase